MPRFSFLYMGATTQMAKITLVGELVQHSLTLIGCLLLGELTFIAIFPEGQLLIGWVILKRKG